MKNSTISRCRLAAILSLFWLLASVTMTAQPVSDGNGQTAATGVSSTISISNFIVPTNDNRLLVVCTTNSSSAAAPSLVFGSTSMNQATSRSTPSGLRVTMFYLVLGSGASVTETITATGTALNRMGASSYHNVNQSTPFDGATNQIIAAGVTSSTLAISSTADDLPCDCIGYFANGFTGMTEASGQTQIFQSPVAPTPAIGLAMSTRTGASPSVDMTWTLNGTTTGGTGVQLGVNLKSASCPTPGSILYVDGAAASGGTGASWACAFQNLQDAINAASSGNEIWVKAGTYFPTKEPDGTTDAPRDFTFYLKNGVAIYGGFDGTETMRSERDWENNLTTLSGDIGTANDSTDNCYHVVLSVSDAATTVLDGFTVEKGNGSAFTSITVETISISRYHGGGLHTNSSSPTVANCSFARNKAGGGGGAYNSGGSTTYSNCTFTLNRAQDGNTIYNGGGMNNFNATLTLTDCTFSNNTAGYGGGMFNNGTCSLTLTGCNFLSNNTGTGGGIYNTDAAPISMTLNECIFSGNTATLYGGGGIYNDGTCTGTATNCLFSGNKACHYSGLRGGALAYTNCTFSGNWNYCYETSPTILASSGSFKNCIFWNNRSGAVTGSATSSIGTSTAAFTYSLAQAVTPSGTGNLNGITNAANSNYPNFTTPLDPATAPSTAGDFHIQTCSPAVNAGTNTGAPTTDLFGNTRPYNNGVADIGVHELQAAQSTLAITCPANQTATAPYNLADFTGLTTTSGGCGTISVSQNPAIGTSLAVGNHTVTMTATDANGLTATCTFSISVNSGCPATGSIWYVDASAASGGNGASWSCGFQNLQDAINAASSGHEIWVKAGTYLPTKDPFGSASPTDPRDKIFYLKNGVALYGGFDGSETMRSERDWAANPTILSGDIGTAGDNSDNAYHVVLSVNDANTTILDGFTIEKGNANGSGSITVESSTVSRAAGGGLRGIGTAMLVSNCQFSGNVGGSSGGGGSYFTSGSTATLTNCQFLNNSTTAPGGGMFINGCSPTLTDCWFSGNSSSSGGGLYNINAGANPVLTRCIFLSNTGTSFGGGMHNYNGVPVLTNCLFSGNHAGSGGGMFNNQPTANAQLFNCTFSGNHATSNGGAFYNVSSSTATLTNCLIWNNRANGVNGSADASLFIVSGTVNISYSLVQNWNPAGTGNLDGIPNAATSNYPDFVTPLDPATAPSTAGDFHIGNCSPVLNLGTNSGAPATDLFGNARPFGTTIDLGVHELQSATDATPPSITCPSNATVSANASCQASLADYTASTTASDNCSAGATKSQSPASGTTLSAGNHTVTMTATDPVGNTATCNFTVAVADQTAPTISCPANSTVAAGANCTATLADFATSATAADNCGTPTKTQSPAAGTSLSLGNQTVTLTATDGASNSATCSFTISVADQTAPTISCPANSTVAAGANCTATLADFASGATTSDNCGTPTKTQSPAAGTSLSLGNQTVTLTATDGASNSATCSFTISVADQTAPTISCPTTQTVSADNFGNYVLANFAAATTSSDNCGAPTESQNPTAGTTLAVGNHTVTMTATDAANNSATCTFTIQVQAGCAAPILTCPTTQTVSANSNCQAVLADFTGSATTSGGCGNLSFAQNPTAGTTLPLGNQIVTLTATDQSNNSGTCTFTVTVADQTTPSITCPTTQTVSADNFGNYILANFAAATTSSDNCGAPTESQNPTAGTTLAVGNHTVTMTATDAANNSATCTFTIQVQAGCAAPILTCPTTQTVSANSNCQSILADFTGSATTSGGCGNLSFAQNPTAGTALSLGNQTVTLTATDQSNNSGTCTFTVTVADQTTPSITCPTTQTVSADNFGNYILANFAAATTSSDNCSTPTESQNPTAGTTLAVGNHTVTMTATDAANNSATCTFTIQVQAGCAAPILTCPTTQTVSANSNCQAVLADFTGSATTSGGCGNLSFAQNPTAGTALSLGNQTVTLTATDQSNNSGTCTFTVTVADQTTPSITCPTTQTVSADNFGNYILANFAAATTSSDNCSTPTESQNPTAGTTLVVGNHTVTMTATDAANNSATCTFTIQVQAGCAAPVLTCPTTQTVSANSNCQSILADFTGSATTSGGCGNLSFAQNPTAGTTLPLGNQIVTLTATDQSNNSGTCTFTVTVADQTTPSITCPTTQTVSADNFGNYILANFAAATTYSDNCGAPTESQNPTAGTTLAIGNHTVTMTATDAANNSATCTFTIQVQAGCAAPILTCPATQTVSANSNCQAVLADFTGSATTSGGCGNLSFAQNPTAGTALPLGNQTVMLTATDQSNNSGTCNFTVSVVDQTAPTIACPNDLTVQADGNGDYTLTNFSGNTSSSDNCGSPTESQNPTDGTTLSTGNHTVTMTATDAANNTSTCQFDIEVQSTCSINAQISAPADFCPTPGLTAILTASGSSQFLWESGETTDQIEVAPTITTTYVVTVGDGLGCTATASHTLIVKALPPAAIAGPSPVCFGDVVTLSASGGIGYEWNHDGSTDPSFTLTANSSFIYVVTVTGANGCTMWKAKNLIVKPLPTVAITGDNSICEGQQTKLSTSNFNSQFLWNTGATTPNITVQPMTTTTYTVSVTNINNCQNTASITVNQTGPCTCENDNLLENTGFEDGLAKWTKANLTLTTVAAEVHSGVKAVKICGSSGAGSQKKPALATQTWLLKFWAKQDGGTSTRTAAIQYLGSSNAVLLESSLVVEVGEYTLHEIQLAAPEGTKWVKVKFDKSLGTGCLFVDDFCLIQVVPPLPKLAGTQPPRADFSDDFSSFKNEKLAENEAAPLLEIFPNPTDNFLNFRSLDDLPLLGEVSVLNSLGQPVLRQRINLSAGEQGVLSVEQLPAGAYFLILKSESPGLVVLPFAVF